MDDGSVDKALDALRKIGGMDIERRPVRRSELDEILDQEDISEASLRSAGRRLGGRARRSVDDILRYPKWAEGGKGGQFMKKGAPRGAVRRPLPDLDARRRPAKPGKGMKSPEAERLRRANTGRPEDISSWPVTLGAVLRGEDKAPGQLAPVRRREAETVEVEDGMAKVYRAIPSGGVMELRPGDWVSSDRDRVAFEFPDREIIEDWVPVDTLAVHGVYRPVGADNRPKGVEGLDMVIVDPDRVNEWEGMRSVRDIWPTGMASPGVDTDSDPDLRVVEILRSEGYTGFALHTFEDGSKILSALDEAGEQVIVEQVDFDESDPDFINKERAEDWVAMADVERLINRDWNEEFWEYPAPLFHGTSRENIKEIHEVGLEARNGRRGFTNTDTGSAVFAHPSPRFTEVYASGYTPLTRGFTIQIDTAAMKEDGFMPDAGPEYPVREDMLREQLAWVISNGTMEYYSDTASDGIDPETVILLDDIPRKYIRIGRVQPDGEWAEEPDYTQESLAEQGAMASPEIEWPHWERGDAMFPTSTSPHEIFTLPPDELPDRLSDWLADDYYANMTLASGESKMAELIRGGPSAKRAGYQTPQETVDALLSGKRVTLYRAVPRNGDHGTLPGAFVTPSRAYAEAHGEGNVNGDFVIVTVKASAAELLTYGDDLEFIWAPTDQVDALWQSQQAADAQGTVLPESLLRAIAGMASPGDERLDDASRSYVAEGIMERGGMVGRRHTIPIGTMPAESIFPNAPDSTVALGTYGPKPRELSAWASEIAGFPIRVVAVPERRDLDSPDTVRGSANHGNFTISVTPETTDLTLLHEIAHLMAGRDAEHGDRWVQIATDLYREHISPQAAETFENLMRPGPAMASPSRELPKVFLQGGIMGDGTPGLVARTREGKAIGYLSYVPFRSLNLNDMDESAVTLLDLKVLPEYRRQGLATRLVDAVREAFPDKPIETNQRTPEGQALLDTMPEIEMSPEYEDFEAVPFPEWVVRGDLEAMDWTPRDMANWLKDKGMSSPSDTEELVRGRTEATLSELADRFPQVRDLPWHLTTDIGALPFEGWTDGWFITASGRAFQDPDILSAYRQMDIEVRPLSEVTLDEWLRTREPLTGNMDKALAWITSFKNSDSPNESPRYVLLVNTDAIATTEGGFNVASLADTRGEFIQSVVTHEIGHFIGDITIRRENGHTEAVRAARYVDMFKEYGITPQEISMVSLYATVSPVEAFAELYALFFMDRDRMVMIRDEDGGSLAEKFERLLNERVDGHRTEPLTVGRLDLRGDGERVVDDLVTMMAANGMESPPYETMTTHINTVKKERESLPDGWRQPEQRHADYLAGLVENATVATRVSPETLGKILRDGIIRNAWDTGEPARWRIGRVGNEEGYMSLREKTERNLFGGQPVYGYMVEDINLLDDAEHSDWRDIAYSYGSIVVELDDSVKSRTTYTVGDTLNDTNDLVPTPIGTANPLAIYPVRNPDGYLRVSSLTELGREANNASTHSDFRPKSSYVEAQIHGQRPAVSEIKRVIFTDPELDDPDRRAAQQALKEQLDRLGIPHETHPYRDPWADWTDEELMDSPAFPGAENAGITVGPDTPISRERADVAEVAGNEIARIAALWPGLRDVEFYMVDDEVSPVRPGKPGGVAPDISVSLGGTPIAREGGEWSDADLSPAALTRRHTYDGRGGERPIEPTSYTFYREDTGKHIVVLTLDLTGDTSDHTVGGKLLRRMSGRELTLNTELRDREGRTLTWADLRREGRSKVKARYGSKGWRSWTQFGSRMVDGDLSPGPDLSETDFPITREQIARNFGNTVLHEIGHTVGYEILRSDSEADYKRLFKRYGITPEEIAGISEYATTAPSEAFAEIYSLRFSEMADEMDPDLMEKFDRLLTEELPEHSLPPSEAERLRGKAEALGMASPENNWVTLPEYHAALSQWQQEAMATLDRPARERMMNDIISGISRFGNPIPRGRYYRTTVNSLRPEEVPTGYRAWTSDPAVAAHHAGAMVGDEVTMWFVDVPEGVEGVDLNKELADTGYEWEQEFIFDTADLTVGRAVITLDGNGRITSQEQISMESPGLPKAATRGFRTSQIEDSPGLRDNPEIARVYDETLDQIADLLPGIEEVPVLAHDDPKSRLMPDLPDSYHFQRDGSTIRYSGTPKRGYSPVNTMTPRDRHIRELGSTTHATDYEGKIHRAMLLSTDLVLSGKGYSTFDRLTDTLGDSTEAAQAIVVHEVGHIVGFAIVGVRPNASHNQFIQLFLNYGITPEEVAGVSEYGTTSPAEAFAEIYAMFFTELRAEMDPALREKFERLMREEMPEHGLDPVRPVEVGMASPETVELDADKRGYEPLPGGEWFGAGGCAHLALAGISLYPGLKIAAGWYDDDGRRALGHAVAYDPRTGTAYHFTGMDDAELAIFEYSSMGLVMDQDPEELADHMGIRWTPDEPWLDGGVYEGAEFFQRWFEDEMRKAGLADPTGPMNSPGSPIGTSPRLEELAGAREIIEENLSAIRERWPQAEETPVYMADEDRPILDTDGLYLSSSSFDILTGDPYLGGGSPRPVNEVTVADWWGDDFFGYLGATASLWADGEEEERLLGGKTHRFVVLNLLEVRATLRSMEQWSLNPEGGEPPDLWRSMGVSKGDLDLFDKIVRYTLNHEFGHIVGDRIADSPTPFGKEAMYIGMFEKYRITPEEIASVSEYATTSAVEAFAEIYAMFFSEMIDEMDPALREKFAALLRAELPNHQLPAMMMGQA